MIPLITGGISSIAAVGAHCDDIIIGAGATLLQIARHHPDVVVHALVLTGGGTQREIEEKDAFAALFPQADVRLTVADLPDGHLPDRWESVKQLLAEFRHTCQPDLVLGHEILKWEADLLNPTLYVKIPTEVAHETTRLIAQSYPSQSGRDWFDDEAFLGLMRVRGVQCRAR